MNKPKHQKIIENVFYIIGAVFLFFAAIDGFSSSIDFVTLPIAIYGTTVIFVLAIILRLIPSFNWKNNEGKVLKITKLNKRPFLFLLAILIGLWLVILVKPKKQVETKNKPIARIEFRPIFNEVDSNSFNILILRFEDYIADNETYCIGRAIKENLNIIDLEYKESIIKSVYVTDSIKPPVDPSEVDEIQKRHNADLVIYGLARNLKEECSAADVCFRYLIRNTLSNSIDSIITIKKIKNDLEFIETTPVEIENGNISVNFLTLKKWITSLAKLKSGNKEEGFLELDNIGNDKTLPRDIRSKRYSEIAITYWQLTEYKKALSSISKAIQIDSMNFMPNLIRGSFNTYIGEYDLAFKDFENSISQNPTYSMTYIKRVRAFKATKQYDSAISDLRNAMKYGYNKEKAYIQLIGIYVETRNDKKAIETMNEALSEVNSLNLQSLSLVLPMVLKDKSYVTKPEPVIKLK